VNEPSRDRSRRWRAAEAMVAAEAAEIMAADAIAIVVATANPLVRTRQKVKGRKKKQKSGKTHSDVFVPLLPLTFTFSRRA